MSSNCMYCLENLSKYNLDFSRDIVCGRCVQRLVGAGNIPQKRPESACSGRKVRQLPRIKGNFLVEG